MHIVVYNDTIKSKNFGCQLVSHSLRKAIADIYPSDSVEFIGMEKLEHPKQKPDVIIINGEGSFGSNFKTPGGFKLLEFIINTYYGKVPLYLVNTSIQVSVEYLKQVEYLLAKCELITLREPISYRFLVNNTSLTNMRIFPDLGTYFFSSGNITKDLDIVFGLGAILKNIDPHSREVREYASIINELAEQGYTVGVQQFPGNPINDYEALKPYLSSKVLVNNGTFIDYFNFVKRARLNVTGRHHGSVMSFVGKTPFYTFESNMWKTEGDQLLYGPFDQFTFRDFDKEQLKNNIILNLNRYQEFSEILEGKYAELRPIFDGHIRITKQNDLKGVEYLL